MPPPPGTVGTTFQRDLGKDKELSAKYRGLQGHAQKAEFRLKWAKNKLVEAEMKLEEMTKTETHSHQEVTTGTYLPFRRVWEMEGQDNEGYLAFRSTNEHHHNCIMYGLRPKADTLGPQGWAAVALGSTCLGKAIHHSSSLRE